MKFYLIHDPVAPDVERTQADAKATGHKFEIIERPTDHAGIVALVKEFRAEAIKAPALPLEPMVSTDAECDPSPVPSPVAAPKAPAPTPAPAGMHPRIVEIMNGTAAEEFIWGASREAVESLQKIIEERLREHDAADAAKAAPVNPPKRTRPTT